MVTNPATRFVLCRRSLLVGLLVAMVALSGCAAATSPLLANPAALSEVDMMIAGKKKPKAEVIKVDVVDNPHLFVFDEAPVHEDGMPAHGNTFITQGYIYPHGTLNGSNGVLPDGEPEFPDKVIGKWICQGWFVGDGAHATTGPMALTTQYFEFNEEYDNATLVTEGYEGSDVNQSVTRAVTGGTGQFMYARGEAMQELLGFNEQMAVNLRMEIQVGQ